MVARGTALAERYGVDAYYVRTAPARVLEDPAAIGDWIEIKNRGAAAMPASDLVSTDFLQLVRFGLRSAHDPFVRDTLKVVDGLIRCDSPAGAVWYRYNNDGYGETEDGGPFEGYGKGRPWPLLAGERGHYAVAAGEDGRPYLRTMMATAGRSGLFPEQVWDGPAVPRAGLRPGKPSGSAMPLVWSHAEFVKLVASLDRGSPIDRPDAVWRRYRGERPPHPERAHWSRRAPIARIAPGQNLRLFVEAPATVLWRAGAGVAPEETPTRYSGFALQVAELPTERLPAGAEIRFALRWLRTGEMEGRDYVVGIG
jgi:glucoamylase